MHDHANQVLIPDKTVEKAVRKALNKPKGPLVSGELCSLSELKIEAGEEDNWVKSIYGLEHAPSLTHLSIRGGYFEKLFLPPELGNLERLELYNCYIGRAEGLENLCRLKELSYAGYPLSDLHPFTGLKELQKMKLMGLDSIDGVQELPELMELDIFTAYPLDISPLQGMIRLTKLRLEGDYITGLNTLEKMTQLEELLLKSWGVRNLEPLKNLVNLKTLCLCCPLEEWHPAWMPRLEELKIKNDRQKRVPAWPGMEKIKKLTLYMRKLKDISSMASLINLEELWLFTKETIDLRPLSEADGLKKLFLRGNLENAKYLCGLKNLQKLDMKACVPAFPEELPLQLDFSGLSNLEELSLHWNTSIIESNSVQRQKKEIPANHKGLIVRGLEALPGLRRLSLGGNVLIEKGTLAKLRHLRELSIFLENFLFVNEGQNALRVGEILSDLKQLRRLTLKSLGIEGERVGNLSGLKNLERLELMVEDPVELENMAGLTNLKYLNMYTTTFDIEKLADMTQLEELSVSADKIENIGLLAEFKNIKSVELVETGFGISRLHLCD